MDNIYIFFQAPELVLQLAIDGILVGAIFALVSYGMALVWGVMNIINIAQGEFVMMGGFITYLLAQAGFNPLYFGIPVSAVVMWVVGWVTYRTVLFRVIEKNIFISILATFGLSILLQQLMNQLIGADVQTVDSGVGSLVLLNGNLVIAKIKLIAFVGALLVGVFLYLFLKKSRMGKAIRATSQNARAARILGVDTNSIYAATLAINAAICGAAGSLVVQTWIVHPFAGLPYTIRSFMIVVVAGLGNIPGVIVSALGLGAAENFAGFIFGAEFQMAFVFILLVIILLWRNYRLSKQRKYLV